MHWVVMDITDMEEIDTDSYDLAIDKSTIDALLCGDDSFLKVALMMKETQRILKPGGHYFAISYGKPEARTSHLERPFLSWELREFILYEANVETEEEKAEKSHYIYVCKKNDDANDVAQLYFAQEYAKLTKENEYQKELEKEYGNELLDSESDDPNEKEKGQHVH